ncbi:xanthine phosphoribosyltransferase [Vibrio crassostreae]|nr:xanthine phosphoribosyltransferase [Vibrio crassostreae]
MTVVKAPEGDGEGFLIVEDLVDSGDTARKLREMYPKAKLIAVCAKPSGADLLDEYIVDIAQDTWIEQPWDTSLSYVEPVNRKSK